MPGNKFTLILDGLAGAVAIAGTGLLSPASSSRYPS